MLTFLLVLGILFAFLAELYYIREIYQKKVRISLSGFIIFFLSSVLGGLSSIHIFGLVYGIIPLSFCFFHLWILYAAYSTHYHSGWNHYDSFFILLAIFSVIGWIFFHMPIFSLLFSFFIDCISYISILKKMFYFPKSESFIAWLFVILSYLMSLFSGFIHHHISFQYNSLSYLNLLGSLMILIFLFFQKNKKFY